MQEKQIQLGGLNANYKIIGAGKTPVVLLHGWGVSSDKYVVTAEKILEQDSSFVFYIPDLPGFGKSEEPKTDWKLDDYAGFVREFIKTVAQRDGGFELVKNIIELAITKNGDVFKKTPKKVILMGHSNGGRIAIKYATQHPEDIETLILTGAAGIKHRLTAKQNFFFNLSKAGKKICSMPGMEKTGTYARKFLYKIMREKDYGKASVRMKEVMKNALAEDLTPILENIKVPTALIWGKNDNSTPIADAEIMHKKIANSKFFIIEGANHSAPYNNPEEFAKMFVSSVM